MPRVYVPAYAEPVVRLWAEAYAGETGATLPFDLDPRAPGTALDRVSSEPNSLLLSAGPPPSGWFVTPIASVPVIVLVNPDNPIRDLSPSDLESLFARRIANWSALGGGTVDVQPVLPLAGEPVREWWESVVLGGTPPWPGTWLAPTPRSMLDLVASDRGAVGILLGSEIPASVVALRILGVQPSADGYPYHLDLLAFAPKEPVGPMRAWLGWVQAYLKAR